MKPKWFCKNCFSKCRHVKLRCCGHIVSFLDHDCKTINCEKCNTTYDRDRQIIASTRHAHNKEASMQLKIDAFQVINQKIPKAVCTKFLYPQKYANDQIDKIISQLL